MDLKIVDELKQTIETNTSVHAMWIGGSVAEGYADELSDIDLYIDIDDGQDAAIFNLVEDFIRTKGKLDISFGENVSPPFAHKVYHLAHMVPHHYIEITLHTHSNEYQMHKYGTRKIEVLFDKDGTTNFKPFDAKSHDLMLKERKKFLLEKIAVGELSVTKEITRRQFMDALHNYQFWLVDPIIELARIKYAPLKVTYGLKHGSRDLPKDTVAEIESLYIIASLQDLGNKLEDIKKLVKKYG